MATVYPLPLQPYAHPVKVKMLYQVNTQQWFNLDCIEVVDDYGHDIGVTLKGGRTIHVSGGDRARFFAAINPKPILVSGGPDGFPDGA